MSNIFFTYILECNDKTYYAGYTTDINRRVYEHNHKIGCKYTRTRLPVKLRYYHIYNTKSEAMSEEWRIKHRLSRFGKISLINSKMNEYHEYKNYADTGLHDLMKAVNKYTDKDLSCMSNQELYTMCTLLRDIYGLTDEFNKIIDELHHRKVFVIK